MGLACSAPEQHSGSGADDHDRASRKKRDNKIFNGAFLVPGLNVTSFQDEYQEGNQFSEKVGVVRNKITTRYDVGYKLPKTAAPCTDGEKISSVLKQLQSIEHQNVCHLKEGFDSPCAVILIYQKVEGEVLHKSVKKNGFSEQKAAGIGFSLVRALSAGAAVEPPIVHGALLPKNILVCSSGNVVLTDLGLIDLLKPDPVQKIEKRDFAYMAPEVIRPWLYKQEQLDETGANQVQLAPNERAVKTSACDVWSLGVILFELMSGRRPFEGRRAVDLGRRILESEPDFARMDVGSKGQALIKSMLHKSAEKRPTLKQLLSHKWLVDPHANEDSGKPFDPAIYDHLISVHAESNLKKMTMRLIAEKVSPKQIKGLTKAFNKADKNHDGMLTLGELRHFLKKHPEMSALGDDLEKAWDELDGDGSGHLSIHEFVAATLDTQEVMIHEVLWKTFHGMDANHNGKLSLAEVKRVVQELHGRLGQDHVGEIMSSLENEIDHDLTFKEFCALVNQEGGRKPTSCCSRVGKCSPCQIRLADK